MICSALRQLEETTSWLCPEGRRLIGFHATEAGESGTQKNQMMTTSESEPLFCPHYIGPEANPDARAMGAYRNNKFN